MKILVIGAGAMGSGIAPVAAQAGHDVYLRDIDMKFVEKGLAGIGKNLGRLADKGKIAAADKDAALARPMDLYALMDPDKLVMKGVVGDLEG